MSIFMALMEQDVKKQVNFDVEVFAFFKCKQQEVGFNRAVKVYDFFASEFLNITGVRVFSDNNNHAFIVKLV